MGSDLFLKQLVVAGATQNTMGWNGSVDDSRVFKPGPRMLGPQQYTPLIGSLVYDFGQKSYLVSHPGRFPFLTENS